MKKTLAVLLTAAIAFLLFGCATVPEESEDGIPNPLRESTADEILQTLGITFNLPQEAQDVSYSIIEIAEANPIAQAQFTLNDAGYAYRIQSTDAFTDISGSYYDWTTIEAIDIAYCSGELRYIEGGAGICLWYDIVPGLMYSVSTDTGTSRDSLLSLADELYVPAKDVP